MKKIIGAMAIFCILYSCSPGKPLIVADPVSITNAIDSARWQFVPVQAFPLVGRTRILTSDFLFQYNAQKIVCNLPYFGRANPGANVMTGRGPLDFTSVDFAAETLRPKEGEWNITIKPKDYSEVQQMSFNFYNNGNATLDVIMTNRSAIRFTGNVMPVN